MKTTLNKLRGHEKGQAFILVLILLLLGGLMIGPLLGFMGTGLITGQAYEKRMAEVYAADAGVELAIWELKLNGLVVDEGSDETLTPFTMNDKIVEATIDAPHMEEGEMQTYLITSIATGDDSSTTVVSYLAPWDLSFFLDNVITSGGEITLPGGGEGEADINPPDGENGPVENYPQENWPTATAFSSYYLSQVDQSDPYPDDTLDLDGVDTSIGATYVDGEFSIYNSSNTVATLTLTDTLYIKGDAEIGKAPKPFILNLNGQTIFVESASADPQKALWLGANGTITGNGCIIVIGDIEFSPDIESAEGQFVFLMSVEGTVWFKPLSDFYGSIAGNVEVQLNPGVSATWTPPPSEGEGGLNFPTGSVADLEIATWEINPPG